MFRDEETLKIWRDKAKQLQHFENSKSKLKNCEYLPHQSSTWKFRS